jgi:hypothetical protein
MTLVIVGLLLGFAGLVWVMVIEIILSDRQSSKRSSPKVEMPVKGPNASESRAA